MSNSEKVNPMTDGQKNEIVETIVGAMPSLNFDQAQAIIGNKAPFVSGIRALFEPYLGSKPTAKEAASAPPTELTIGDRVYELLPFLKEGESLVTGNTMLKRALELNANLGKEDGYFILEHQNEIPQEFQGKFSLVFMGWRGSLNPQNVACLHWNSNRWCQLWPRLADDWGVCDRLVRRRTSTRA